MTIEGESLELKIGEVLRQNNLTLSVAESCTGGLISHRITNTPGSSDYFEMGIVTYSNRSKMQLLDVPKLIIESFGAVSQETARAMAEGVKKVAQSDVGLSVTGIAGPAGGTPTKPVGLVYMGIASQNNTTVKEFRFQGSRSEIKKQSSDEALKVIMYSI
jgi:PncC family amidohydrolase